MIPGLQLSAPSGFAVDQRMVTLRGAPSTDGDPRILNKQTAIRPNLIIHRRAVGGASLEVLAGEMLAELVSGVEGLSALTHEALEYADGALGTLIGFDVEAPEVGTARQFHALRKDGDVLTTMSLTIDKLTLNDDTRARWQSFFSGAVRDGEGGLS